jgi:hypothetical protein
MRLEAFPHYEVEDSLPKDSYSDDGHGSVAKREQQRRVDVGFSQHQAATQGK